MPRLSSAEFDSSQRARVPEVESVSRTFRIPSSVARKVMEEARRREVSANSLLNQLLVRFVDFERFRPRLDVACLNLAVLKSLARHLDSSVLAKEGEKLGAGAIDFLKISGRPIDPESYRFFVQKILGDYAGWFTYEAQQTGNLMRLALHHKYGKGWSIFLHSYLNSALKKMSVQGRVELTGDILEVSFELAGASSRSGSQR